MAKRKLGVIFGGMSTENEVSINSANSILNNLNRQKYEIYPIYIDKEGVWWKYTEQENEIKLGNLVQTKEKLENEMQYLRQLDILFPVLHGLYGEDGTIQGLFELIKLPYVGCHVLASSIGMDKVYTKIVFNQAGLKQAKYLYIRKYKDRYFYMDKNFNETILERKEVVKKISQD